MRLKGKKILAIYSDTSLQEVEVAFIVSDGLDILEVKNSFARPYPYELKDKLLNVTTDQLADKKWIDALNQEVTDFFTKNLQEAIEEFSEQPEFIALMGPVIQNSTNNKQAVEMSDLNKIANTFHRPVIGHFMQDDLTAGGVGSPLKAVFWDTLARNMEKPVAVANVGGILKLTYLGPNGEIIAFDAGIGLSLMDEWVFKKTGQSRDDDGWLSAQGKADEKVLKALLGNSFLEQKPPKAVETEKFDTLLEQLEGLSVADGCATLVNFFVESFKTTENFLPEKPKSWIIIGGGVKNPSLVLALKQALPNVQKATECFGYQQNLNAIGTAFLGARHLAGLPISLPTTTGVPEALSVGEVFDPEDSK